MDLTKEKPPFMRATKPITSGARKELLRRRRRWQKRKCSHAMEELAKNPKCPLLQTELVRALRSKAGKKLFGAVGLALKVCESSRTLVSNARDTLNALGGGGNSSFRSDMLVRIAGNLPTRFVATRLDVPPGYNRSAKHKSRKMLAIGASTTLETQQYPGSVHRSSAYTAQAGLTTEILRHFDSITTQLVKPVTTLTPGF